MCILAGIAQCPLAEKISIKYSFLINGCKPLPHSLKHTHTAHASTFACMRNNVIKIIFRYDGNSFLAWQNHRLPNNVNRLPGNDAIFDTCQESLAPFPINSNLKMVSWFDSSTCASFSLSFLFIRKLSRYQWHFPSIVERWGVFFYRQQHQQQTMCVP